MMYRKYLIGALILLGAVRINAQNTSELKDQNSNAVVMPYEEGFSPSDAARNVEYWQNEVRSDNNNEGAWLNLMLANRQQGTVNFYLYNNADAVQIADSIAVVAPGSFEAHFSQYMAKYPTQEAFSALENANNVDASRDELIGPNLEMALTENNKGLAEKEALRLYNSNRIAPALNSVADDLTLALDNEAIIFCEGEMDCYPLYARQAGIGKPDPGALIIQRQLLKNEQYALSIWQEAVGEGSPPTGVNAIIKAVCERSERPVYLALSLDRSILNELQSKLYVVGNVFRYSNGRYNNIPELEKNWSKMSGVEQQGPLNGNYLLPAIVLQNHYSTSGDKKKLDAIEKEVREVAERNGKTRQLMDQGILKN